MTGLVVHILVSAALIYVLGRMVSGIQVEGGKAAILAAIGLGVANAYVRPLLIALTLPITILTLGLFIWVVNALMLLLVAAVVRGFEVRGFKSALGGAVLLGLMNFLAGMLLRI